MPKARDFMTRNVVVAAPDATTQELARLLLDNSISAAPIVDSSGAPIGMVSEGDLIGRTDTDRDARRDWWLDMLAEGEALAPEFLKNLNHQKTARDIMAAPVVTVDENAEAADIIDLLQTHRVKRVPVVRDARIVGIVSRADILRALAAQARDDISVRQARSHNLLSEAILRLDAQFFGRAHAGSGAPNPQPNSASVETDVSAAGFRNLVVEFEHGKDRQRDEARSAKARERDQTVQQTITRHVADRNWRALLRQAQEAAARGEKEIMLIRFPSKVCTDGGRAINVAEPRWPETLRGEPAEIYLHWEHELKPLGFHLNACILEFPDDLPGDTGLFLSWA